MVLKKVACTLVDLLFIELMSHISHVKQIYCRTFLLGFVHFHSSRQLDRIQVASSLGNLFASVASKLFRTQSRLSQSLYALKEFADCLFGALKDLMILSVDMAKKLVAYSPVSDSRTAPKDLNWTSSLWYQNLEKI